MDILEQQIQENETFKCLSIRDKLINSLYHIDGVATKDICKLPKQDIQKGVCIVGKNIYMFSNITKQVAQHLDTNYIVSAQGKALTNRAINLVTSKVELTDLPVVNKIVDSLDILFDENLSLDEALDKADLDLTQWKYPISKQGAMFKPYYKTGVGVDKTLPTYVYILKYLVDDKEFIKFGITKDLDKRLGHSGRLNKTNIELLYSKKFKSGKKASDIENKIKRTINCGVVGKDVLPDGYTETCSVDCYNNLLNIINS